MSHPAWVCGLKPGWINYTFRPKKSHPAWVCGLKRKNIWNIRKTMQKSHPAWVCGLKLMDMNRLIYVSVVTPCVGVWIET